MGPADRAYSSLLKELLSRKCQSVTTRNALCSRVFPWMVRFESTPLVTLRKTSWRSALREWEWFMSGSNNINDLYESVRPWWQPWANERGEIWGNYGQQFRHFAGDRGLVDQVQLLISGITHHPYSRRNVITTWNTADMADKRCPITNCHGTVIQAFVDPLSGLHLSTYQRSIDVVCGLPHNWIQYWAFLLWLCRMTGSNVGSLVWIGGDVHLYEEHKPLARRILRAEVQEDPPNLVYGPDSEPTTFLANDFDLDNEYQPGLLERARMIV